MYHLTQKKWKRGLAALLAAAIGAVSLGGCGLSASVPTLAQTAGKSGGTAGTAGLTKLRLGIMANSSGAYAASIALANGYFKKYGLDVTTATCAAGINTVDSVTMGQLDIGYVADFAAINRFGSSKRNELRIFAKLNSTKASGTTLYVAPGIRSLADLKGKGIVTQLGTATEYYVAKTLEKGGLKSTDVKLLPVQSGPEMLAVMQSGQASACWAFGQTEQKLRKTKKFTKLTTLDKICQPTLAFAIASDSFLRENSKTAAAYLKGMQDASTFISKNPKEAAALVEKQSGVPQETVLATFSSTDFTIDFKKPTWNTLNSIYSWMEQNQKVKNSYTVKDYVSLDILEKTFPNTTESVA